MDATVAAPAAAVTVAVVTVVVARVVGMVFVVKCVTHFVIMLVDAVNVNAVAIVINTLTQRSKKDIPQKTLTNEFTFVSFSLLFLWQFFVFGLLRRSSKNDTKNKF